MKRVKASLNKAAGSGFKAGATSNSTGQVFESQKVKRNT